MRRMWYFALIALVLSLLGGVIFAMPVVPYIPVVTVSVGNVVLPDLTGGPLAVSASMRQFVPMPPYGQNTPALVQNDSTVSLATNYFAGTIAISRPRPPVATWGYFVYHAGGFNRKSIGVRIFGPIVALGT